MFAGPSTGWERGTLDVPLALAGLVLVAALIGLAIYLVARR
jgi:hypothetical protein